MRATLLSTTAAIPLSHALAQDEGPPLPRNMYGSVGMIDLPTARMAPDGEISAGAGYFKNNQRYNINFQAFPWLETSFRYSGLQHFDPTFPVYYDRSFEVKARLWNEDGWLPAVAIGINDIVGTGIYGGEYVVASKQFGAVDASLGMGWGRLGTANTIRNPLGVISSSAYNRSSVFTGQGGNFNFGQYFHGPNAGIFGGLTWRTPLDGLTLIGEISSDDYQQEALTGSFKPRNQLNLGASYQLYDGLAFGLNWIYGRSLGGNVSFQLDPTTQSFSEKIGAPPPTVPVVRNDRQQRHALQKMLNGPEPLAAADAAQMGDALWRQQGVRDIAFFGRTLLLQVSPETPAMRCLDAGRILQSYESDVTAVILRPGGGRPDVHCATPAAPESDFRNGLFVGADVPAAPRVIPAVLTIDASATRADTKNAIHAITADARREKITIHAVQLTDSVATVYYSNYSYFEEGKALMRLTAILMKEAPPDIEEFRLLAVLDGRPLRQFDILRGPQERKYAVNETLNVDGDADGATMAAAPMNNPVYDRAVRGGYPQFGWSVFPQFRQQFFDPNNPVGVQFLADLQGTLSLVPGLSLTGSLETSLFDTFRTDRLSNSVLPHVRTDLTRYFAQGKTGLGQVESDYEFRLAPNVMAIARVGYLESMFGGAGGEILWRPENQRWALGIDGYQVWQRNFDRLFGFQQYHVFTGHISAYYESPWYGLNFAAHAGQYLAGDRGVTIEITRRFWTGVEVGAFVTKTNVSSQQFGEGSFDKGIIIRIPLGWALPMETPAQFGMDLRPIQRDGGQRLVGDTVLYTATQRTSRGEIYRIREGQAEE